MTSPSDGTAAQPTRQRPGGTPSFEAVPAWKRPQGRTQAWQAQQRRASRGLRGQAREQIEGQTSLDDLAAEGGLADE